MRTYVCCSINWKTTRATSVAQCKAFSMQMMTTSTGPTCSSRWALSSHLHVSMSCTASARRDAQMLMWHARHNVFLLAGACQHCMPKMTMKQPK